MSSGFLLPLQVRTRLSGHDGCRFLAGPWHWRGSCASEEPVCETVYELTAADLSLTAPADVTGGGVEAAALRIYDVNRFLRRVLGEADGKGVDLRGSMMDGPALPLPHGPTAARDFILNSPDRPEIETRYEQVFSDILGLTSARCQSRDEGPLTQIKIQFDRSERPGITLGYLHFILRDLPKEFGRRIVPKSALMWSVGDEAKLTFALEPAK